MALIACLFRWMILASLFSNDLADVANCGLSTGWGANYTAFHNRTLYGNDKSGRFLVAVPNLSGMADRVIGFVTVFMMSILTNRAFQIGNRQGLPIFEDAFYSPNNVNWSRPIEEEWLIEPLKHKASIRNYNSSILEKGEYFAVNTIDDFKLQDRLLRQDLNQLLGGNARTTLISINRGKTIRMFENGHHNEQLTRMGLTSYTAFGCLLNYLIQPKAEVFQHIPDQHMKMTDPNPLVLKISIQIRVGDSSLSSPDHKINLDHYSAYFSCAEQIETFATAAAALRNEKYSHVLWYLASDSKSLRAAAVSRYGSQKVVTSLNTTVEHTAKEHCKAENCAVSSGGFHLAAAEWWLMGYADYHVITQYSGYGRSAAMRSLRKDTTYTVNYKRTGAAIRCDNTSFSDLETLSFDWSGI